MKSYFTAVMVITTAASLFLAIHKNLIHFNSTVSIKNNHWEKLHIQVRKGYSPNPDNDKLIFDQSITMGHSHAFIIDNGDDILYRRDRDPSHPDGIHFTNWTYANCDDSAVCKVDNP
ncbi:MAG: hypothetical protein ACXVAU_10035 [Mucilaginibacter sp.]